MVRSFDVNQRMEHYHVSGLSMTMIRNGQIHKTETYGVLEAGTSTLVDQQTLFHACSISKFVSSMLVMKLTAQGILDLDEDVNDRLTSWKVPHNTYTQAYKVTLRTLLSHQAGIIDPENSFTELDPNTSIPKMANLLTGNASGLWSTSTDLARLVIELMDSLRGQSKIGISEKYAREMVTSQGCREWTGLGVFLEGNGQDMVFSSLGWGGRISMHDPRKSLCRDCYGHYDQYGYRRPSA